MTLRSWMRRSVPHEPGAPVVRFSHVTVRYDGGVPRSRAAGLFSGAGDLGEPALDDVSFELARGERVAVVGPNGAGKSTLLKVIAGILAPSAGSVDVYGHTAGGHTCIGYVPQRTQVDWNFPVSVAEVVMMGRVARMGLFRHAGRDDWRRVHESLAQVGMLELAGRQIGELSGGQQQRVFIARALAQEAELLLMDEPLTGLDVPSQEAIFEILDTLRAGRISVVVSTHDLHLATDRFDRLMLLRHRLLGLGKAAEVLTPTNLSLAYGSQMTLLEMPEGTVVLEDTCCEGQ